MIGKDEVLGSSRSSRDTAAWWGAQARVALGFGILLVLSTVPAFADQRGAASDGPDSIRGFSGFPAVYYTDETGIAGGGYLVYSQRLAGASLSSSLSTFLAYTQKRQTLAGALLECFGKEYSLTAAAMARDYPNTFYGVGRNSREADLEEYTDRGVEITVSPQRRLRPGLFAGPLVILERHHLTGIAPAGRLEAALGGAASTCQVVGAGGMLTWDTRDNAMYPTRGSYQTASWVRFGEAIGSDRDFTAVEVNLRRYLAVTARQVAAFQLLWTSVGRDAPLTSYPVLGDGNLRGFASRYTDRSLAMVQAEYRARLSRRWGVAGFAGLGDVAPRNRRLSLAKARFGAGIGLRYLMAPQTGLNLRVDLGLGTGGSSSLTFIPREAF